jgi:hypothetical protein
MPTKSGASSSPPADAVPVPGAVVEAIVAEDHDDTFAVLGMHADRVIALRALDLVGLR